MDETAPTSTVSTTINNPWPIRLFSQNFSNYINKIPSIWLEGELIQSNIRGNSSFFVIKDLQEDIKLSFHTFSLAITYDLSKIETGSRVVVNAKPTFWKNSGKFSLNVFQIEEVGVGDLMVRLAKLKESLTKEGIFDADKKKKLPFLPKRIALICGRDAKAKDDVLENVHRRWPSMGFIIYQVPVQGEKATSQIINALHDIKQYENVSVVVIARGGGSFSDLLPFSDEKLIRAVYEYEIPVVSAIGHETDTPLLDYVADFRASTPTDAAKNIVPNIIEETEKIKSFNKFFYDFFENKYRGLNTLLDRPVLANPLVQFEQELFAITNRLNDLSPRKVLERGYAVITNTKDDVIIDSKQVNLNENIYITLSQGDLLANVKSKNNVENKN